tara:strand:+ start:334 stop:513 length:180 start_codon:yes stop_codon:yes gene_type:complete
MTGHELKDLLNHPNFESLLGKDIEIYDPSTGDTTTDFAVLTFEGSDSLSIVPNSQEINS